MPVGPVLLLAFLVVPMIEVALFVQVGGWIGLWPTLLAIVVTAVVGSAVIRHQGFDLARRAQSRLAAGDMPVREGFDGLCLVVAGLLMITPGFFTDAVGGLLLVPALRGFAYSQVAGRISVGVRGSGAPPGGRAGPVVDAEYEVVDDQPDAEIRPTLPPRGGWGRDGR